MQGTYSPVFRWIDWADELKMTAEEYWAEQGVLTQVDGMAVHSLCRLPRTEACMVGRFLPLLAALKDGAPTSQPKKAWVWAECLMDVPEVAEDLEGKINMEHWHLEGRVEDRLLPVDRRRDLRPQAEE